MCYMYAMSNKEKVNPPPTCWRDCLANLWSSNGPLGTNTYYVKVRVTLMLYISLWSYVGDPTYTPNIDRLHLT